MLTFTVNVCNFEMSDGVRYVNLQDIGLITLKIENSTHKVVAFTAVLANVFLFYEVSNFVTVFDYQNANDRLD